MTPHQPSPAIDSLQFEKAELQPAGRKCTLCAKLIDAEYYQLAGADVCPACAEPVRAGQQRPQARQLLRGALSGGGAAIVCALGYGLVTYLTGMEFALLTILVGWLVGTAIRNGSGGLGGRRCQWMALFFTFLAIAGGYVPVIFRELTQEREKIEMLAQKAKAEGKQTLKYGQMEMPVQLPERSSRARLFYAIMLALFSPFFALMSGLSGLLGTAILVFGLHRAWRLTARDSRLVAGPFREHTSAA